MASGKKCLGRFVVRQEPVIVIDEDTPTDTLEDRIDRLCAFFRQRRQDLPLELDSMTGFDLEKDIGALVARVKAKRQPVLVVIDSLVAVAGSLDTNQTTDARKIAKALALLKLEGADILLVHHLSSKGRDDGELFDGEFDFSRKALGNTQLVAMSDTVFGMWSVMKRPKTVFGTQVRPRRASIPTPHRFGLQLHEDQAESWACVRYREELPRMPTAAAVTIMPLFAEERTRPFFVKDVDEALGKLLPITGTRDALEELREADVLNREKERHNKFKYRLNPDFDNLASEYAMELKQRL